jgi:hypothetical protein
METINKDHGSRNKIGRELLQERARMLEMEARILRINERMLELEARTGRR